VGYLSQKVLSNIVCIIGQQVIECGKVDSVAYAVEEGWHFKNGDADRSGNINILDVAYDVNYLYRNGPAPDPVVAADADCNGKINILDVSYIISYLYRNGPKPCEIE